jgi:hypothetical protein
MATKPQAAQPADKPKKMRTIINQSIGEIVWPFPTLGQQTLHLERVSAAIKERAVFHGLSARGTDSMALNAADYGGRVPEQARWDALKQMLEHLESGTGDWDMARAGRGPSVSSVKFLLAALCEAFPKKSREAHVEWLKEKTPAEQASLAANAKLKPIIDRMTAEATNGIDSDAMLDELEDEMGEDEETTEE